MPIADTVNGRIIAIEGLPGAGKTTCFHRLIAAYAEDGRVFFHEANPPPGLRFFSTSPHWRRTYYHRLWQGRLATAAELLTEGKTVFFDRTFLSNVAYLHASCDPAYRPTVEHFRRATRSCVGKSLLLVIDLPVEVILRRKFALGVLPPPWCHPHFLERMRDFYHRILPRLCGDGQPVVHLDGRLSRATLAAMVKALVADHTGLSQRGEPIRRQRHPDENRLLCRARELSLGGCHSPVVRQLGRPTMFFRNHALWVHPRRGVELLAWHRRNSVLF
jgi:thymidylate kinase